MKDGEREREQGGRRSFREDSIEGGRITIGWGKGELEG